MLGAFKERFKKEEIERLTAELEASSQEERILMGLTEAIKVDESSMRMYEAAGRHKYFAFAYGELVLVKRSSGEMCFAQIVSNAKGKNILEWSAADLEAVLTHPPFDFPAHLVDKGLDGPAAARLSSSDLQDAGLYASYAYEMVKKETLRIPKCLFEKQVDVNEGSNPSSPLPPVLPATPGSAETKKRPVDSHIESIPFPGLTGSKGWLHMRKRFWLVLGALVVIVAAMLAKINTQQDENKYHCHPLLKWFLVALRSTLHLEPP
jgi:hypothetical protein